MLIAKPDIVKPCPRSNKCSTLDKRKHAHAQTNAQHWKNATMLTIMQMAAVAQMQNMQTLMRMPTRNHSLSLIKD
jgi:hypothetical protein